jgi:hypothetical protein
LPFREALTPTSYSLPDDLTPESWLEVGRALGRVRGSVMWWVGDWWAYGKHRYGEREAAVEAEEWEGPRFQTCMNAALVCRAFETSRRREVVSFTAHGEVTVLPVEWQDKILDEAEGVGYTQLPSCRYYESGRDPGKVALWPLKRAHVITGL